MDKKIDLVCDQCGGMMTLSTDRREMHCEYCGNVVILPDKEQEEKVAYAKRKAETFPNLLLCLLLVFF